MAALDRRNPNLDDFVGLNWSCWVDRVNILPSDAGSKAEDSSRYGRNCSETMTLRKEGEVKNPGFIQHLQEVYFTSSLVSSADMHIYGYCPAHDELYLVVCSHCGEVVKPQAFEKHCERRHGPATKMCGQSSTLAPQQRPRPGLPLSNMSSSRERQKEGRCHEASAPPSAALPVRQHRPNKAQKEAVSREAPSGEPSPPTTHLVHASPQGSSVAPWTSAPWPLFFLHFCTRETLCTEIHNQAVHRASRSSAGNENLQPDLQKH
ncbi:Ataxin-7-like protein 2 [Nibea albiflora]|uniref:Ataxin-7-like protein 2 n=1 Tax=Nibea albiflora TaxID=240163 RepID=A0ACB7ELP7_NIBAL|nr:Ataxin-7-like protein 2 [Nibea albiflora]